jgi:hypothetical protein
MDKTTYCSSLRDALLVRFANELEVSSQGDACIVTLPFRTADHRFIDVYVEPVAGSGFTYVHDAGKSTAELFVQGIHENESQTAVMKGIARTYDAYFQNGRFQIICKNIVEIENAVLAIAQCASLAMVEVVTHEPKIEDEPLTVRVGRALQQWQPTYVEIERRHVVRGTTGVEHMFDYVSRPLIANARTVAVKLLPPSVGPSWQVSRYALLALDIRGREAEQWPRVAIISKADDWTQKSIDIVRSLSSETIVLDTDDEARVERVLPVTMTALTEAA